MLDRIQAKVLDGERVTREEAFYLLTKAPLLDLAPLAQTVRFRRNPETEVTFVVDTNMNYTNVCDAHCTFCAFYRNEGDEDAYTHTVEEMMDRVGKAAEAGVTTVLLQGGLNKELPLDYYVHLVSESLRRYPDMHPHFFSAPEVMKMMEVSRLPLREVLEKLYEAGLRTIPGGGAEILSDTVRPIFTKLFPKAKTADWVNVHREAHGVGMRSTATMMYGHVEKSEDIIEHLDVIRSLQDETGGFTAFVPWSYKREHSALGRLVDREAGPNKYLRVMAVSRIFLDNFDHVQASWFSEGKKTGVVALHFGGDDFGGTLFEENVMYSAGFYNRVTVDEIIGLIRDAGYTPVQRTTLYDKIRYFNPTMSSDGAPVAGSQGSDGKIPRSDARS